MVMLIMIRGGIFLLVIAVMFTQLIIPLWNGTMLFPIFNRKRRELRLRQRETEREIELLKEKERLEALQSQEIEYAESLKRQTRRRTAKVGTDVIAEPVAKTTTPRKRKTTTNASR